MTRAEALSKIDANVAERLARAITALLNAGRDTRNVAETLAPQQSFGKYEGCTRQAIEAIAIEMCKEHNARIRAEDREILNAAKQSLADYLKGKI